MPYCPNCGNPVNAEDRFCSNCGTAIQVVAVTPAVVSAATGSSRSDYRIVLISRGSCARAVAIDMLSDLLGYADADAARIVDNAPMEMALGLTAIQAQYISQAMNEYGMEVAIYNSDGYVDMGSKATSSVFDSDGGFLSAVASVLTGLTIGNRITSYNRWTQPAPVVFHPVYRRPAPRAAYRRRRPAPIPVVRHAAPPIPHPAPAPRPAPAVRPAPRPAPPRTAAVTRPVTTPRPAPIPPAGPAVTPRPAPGTMNGPHRKGPGGAGRGGRGGRGGAGGVRG